MALTEKLIETVKYHPILFDMNHEDYKNIRKKDKVWKEIGLVLGKNGEELKKKWKNMRDSYAKHLRSLNTSVGPSPKQKLDKWHWAKQMETFRPFMPSAKTDSSITDVTSGENTYGETAFIKHGTSLSPVSNAHELTSDIEEDGAQTEKDLSSREAWTSLRKHIRKTHFRTGSPTKKVIAYLREKHLSNKHKTVKMDAIGLIFSGYAATVKTFSPRLQIIAKLKLAELMSQLELEHEQERGCSSASHTSDITDSCFSVPTHSNNLHSNSSV